MSHHHDALGSVAGWMFEHIGGIKPIEPGYRVVRVQPVTVGGSGDTTLTVSVPWGTKAHVSADGHMTVLEPGEHELLLQAPSTVVARGKRSITPPTDPVRLPRG